ncbi:hypothetical protein KY360_01265 [Candidatus Woesearchaeota archaeon]|nr:hypothetical protein [Candidatus Woesearchaeota archaeon]
MSNLGIAYIASVILTIAGPVGGYFEPAIGMIVLLVHVLAVGLFISKDATQKGLSKNHQLWAWLGIFGVLIYHLVFVKKASQPQQYQQPPMQQQPQQPAQQPPEQQQYPQQPQQPQ